MSQILRYLLSYENGSFVTDQSSWLVRTEIPRCSGGSLIRFSGFPLFEVQGSGFESKIKASFGIENMRRRWDAEKNPRDYGIAGLKNSTGDLASESLVAWVVS